MCPLEPGVSESDEEIGEGSRALGRFSPRFLREGGMSFLKLGRRGSRGWCVLDFCRCRGRPRSGAAASSLWAAGVEVSQMPLADLMMGSCAGLIGDGSVVGACVFRVDDGV